MILSHLDLAKTLHGTWNLSSLLQSPLKQRVGYPYELWSTPLLNDDEFRGYTSQYIHIHNIYIYVMCIYIYTYNIIYIYMWEYHSPWTGNSYKVRAPGTSSFLNLLISSLYSPWTKTWSRLYAVTSPFRFQGPQLVGTVYMLYNPSLSWWNLYNGFIIIDLWDIHI